MPKLHTVGHGFHELNFCHICNLVDQQLWSNTFKVFEVLKLNQFPASDTLQTEQSFRQHRCCRRWYKLKEQPTFLPKWTISLCTLHCVALLMERKEEREREIQMAEGKADIYGKGVLKTFPNAFAIFTYLKCTLKGGWGKVQCNFDVDNVASYNWW